MKCNKKLSGLMRIFLSKCRHQFKTLKIMLRIKNQYLTSRYIYRMILLTNKANKPYSKLLNKLNSLNL